MTTCVFRYCKNTSRNISESSGVSFHRFVHPGHPKREEWIKIIQKDRSEDAWLPTKCSFICSAHFRDDDMYMTKAGKRFLKKSAIPCSNPSEYADKNLEASPTSLDNVEVSDSESIYDTPQIIKLKKDLRKVSASKKALLKKNIKLQRQNKNLRKSVNQLKEKFGINKQKEKELVKKPEV